MNVVDHKCLGCGTPLDFDVKSQKWICKYCRKVYTINDLSYNINKFNNTNNNSYLNEYVCNNCGAKVLGDNTVASTKCPYCGNSVIIKNRLVGNYRPDAIITFRHTPEEIIKIFSKDLKSRMLSDNAFGNIENIEFVSQIYVPYWLVTCEAMASVKGLATVGGKDNKQYKICSRLGAMRFTRVPADAKRNLNNELLQGIEPFNYDELVRFEYPYLAGMFAECYDESGEEVVKNQIKARIEEAAEEQLIRTFPGGERSVHERSTFINKPIFEYILVPIWLVRVKYKNKTYDFCVNDQTCKVSGIRQVNTIKVSILSAVLLGILVIVCLLYITMAKNYGVSEGDVMSKLLYIMLGGLAVESGIMTYIISSYTKHQKGKKSSDYIQKGSFYIISSSNQDSY